MKTAATLVAIISLTFGCKQIESGSGAVAEKVPDIDKGKNDLYKTSTSSDLDSSVIPKPLSIEIFPKGLQLSEGMSTAFTAIGKYPYSTRDLTEHVTWQSMDANIMVFDDPRLDNIATSHGIGSVAITATFEDIESQLEVIVDASKVKSIAIELESPKLLISANIAGGFFSKSVALKAVGVFTNQSILDLSASSEWESSNAEIVVIDKTKPGTVILKKPGKAVVAASFQGVRTEVELDVAKDVVFLKDFTVSDTFVALPMGLSRELKVTGSYSNGEKRDITEIVKYESLNSAIAAFNTGGSLGKVRSTGRGSTVITLEIDGIKKEVPFATTEAVLASIDVTPKAINQPLGIKTQFTAAGTYSDGTVIDITSSVKWTSSETPIGTIGNSGGTTGILSSVALGKTNIKAEFQSLSDTVELTVTDPQLMSIQMNPTAFTVAKGINAVVTATGVYSDGSSTDLTATAKWTSTNVAIASVSDSSNTKGLAYGAGVGVAQIRATLLGVLGQTQATVTAAQVTAIDVTALNPSVALGRTKDFSVSASYTDGTTKLVTEQAVWSFDIVSPGYNYAGYVSDTPGTKGRATSIAEGVVKIIATFAGATDFLDFTVTEKQVTYIQVATPSPTANPGDVLQLTATAFFTNNTSLDVTSIATTDLTINWTEVDNVTYGDVITVNNTTTKGQVAALYEGGVTVTATLSTKWGNFNANRGISVDTNCTFGLQSGNHCFAMGNSNESCDQVCGNLGVSYHLATHYLIGSAGNNSECATVMNALTSATNNISSASQADGKGLGCGILDLPLIGEQIAARYTSPATTGSDAAVDFRRICACAP